MFISRLFETHLTYFTRVRASAFSILDINFRPQQLHNQTLPNNGTAKQNLDQIFSYNLVIDCLIVDYSIAEIYL